LPGSPQQRPIHVIDIAVSNVNIHLGRFDEGTNFQEMGVSKNRETPQNGWFLLMEKPIKNGMIWGEIPLFSETSIYTPPKSSNHPSAFETAFQLHHG